jgi:hypothetical protein
MAVIFSVKAGSNRLKRAFNAVFLGAIEVETDSEARKWNTDQYLEDLYGSKKTKERPWGKPESKASPNRAGEAGRSVKPPKACPVPTDKRRVSIFKPR